MATFPVTTNADTTNENDGQLSLREAITLANTNLGADTIAFDLTLDGATLRLTQGTQLEITDELTIDATALENGLTVSGDTAGNDITFAGTSITNVNGGSNDSFLDDNTRVFAVKGATAKFAGLTITGGVAHIQAADDVGGGGIYALDTIHVLDSNISGNATIGNYAYSASGGGVYARSGASIEASTISQNSLHSGGGGGIANLSGSFTISASTINDNIVRALGGSGGGVFAGSALALTDSTVSGNDADYGGGIFLNDNSNVSTSSLTTENRSNGGSGAYSEGSLTVDKSAISMNLAAVKGGGIFALADVSISSSSLVDNLAGPDNSQNFGGGLYASGGTVAFLNSTVTANQGGGVATSQDVSSTSFSNSIIIGNLDEDISNTAVSNGSNIIGEFLFLDTKVLRQNITAQDVFAQTQVVNPDGVVGNSDDVVAGQIVENEGTIPIVPLLISADNPALDTGIDAVWPGTDANGNFKKQQSLASFGSPENFSDLGASEQQTVLLLETPKDAIVVDTAEDVIFSNDGVTSLRDAIDDANNSPGADTIVFSEALAGQTIVLTRGSTLEITEEVTIAALTENVTISGDVNQNDVKLTGTEFSDLEASLTLAEDGISTGTQSDNLLTDNIRIFKISNDSAKTTLKGLILTGGFHTISGQYDGGGAIQTIADLNIYDSMVIGNGIQSSPSYTSAYTFGGAISAAALFPNTSSVTVDSTTIAHSLIKSDLAGPTGGAGIFATGNVDLTNSTVFENRLVNTNAANSTTSGGGIYGANITVNNSTVVENSVTQSRFTGPAGIFGFQSVVVENSIVTGNYNYGNVNPDIYSPDTISLIGTNIVGSYRRSGEVILKTPVVTLDEIFASTTLTSDGVLELRNDPSNPAIDFGTDADAPIVDQRFFSARVKQPAAQFANGANVSDLGAAELQLIAGAGVATPGDDILIDETGDGLLDGFEGNDLVLGQGGDDTLSGSEGDDQLRGGDGDDVILGGAGRDQLIGGPGDDRLSGGLDPDILWADTGRETFFGTASEVNGDIHHQFGWGDEIRIDGLETAPQLILRSPGHADLAFDTDGSGIQDGLLSIFVAGPDTTEDLELQFSESETVLRFGTAAPAEAAPLDLLSLNDGLEQSYANGIVQQSFLTGDGTRAYEISLLRESNFSASFDNSLGVYRIDADGGIFDAEILYESVKTETGPRVITDVAEGDSLGFFLLQDAASVIGMSGENDVVEFVDVSGAGVSIYDGPELYFARNGEILDVTAFHSFDSTLNPDGVTHALSGFNDDQMTIGMEDLTNRGDGDFEDVVFTVEIL